MCGHCACRRQGVLLRGRVIDQFLHPPPEQKQRDIVVLGSCTRTSRMYFWMPSTPYVRMTIHSLSERNRRLRGIPQCCRQTSRNEQTRKLLRGIPQCCRQTSRNEQTRKLLCRILQVLKLQSGPSSMHAWKFQVPRPDFVFVFRNERRDQLTRKSTALSERSRTQKSEQAVTIRRECDRKARFAAHLSCGAAGRAGPP